MPRRGYRDAICAYGMPSGQLPATARWVGRVVLRQIPSHGVLLGKANVARYPRARGAVDSGL